MFHSGPTMTYNAVFAPFDPAEMPAFEDAYLEMYIYIENLEYMTTDGQIELNSSGANDIKEIYYPFTPDKIKLSAGWNFISLKLTDFIPTDNKFVYQDLMGMRIYSVGSANNSLRVDYITITDAPRIDYLRAHGFTAQSKLPEVIGTVQNENTTLYAVKEHFPH